MHPASHEQLLLYNHKLFKIDNVIQNILMTIIITIFCINFLYKCLCPRSIVVYLLHCYKFSFFEMHTWHFSNKSTSHTDFAGKLGGGLYMIAVYGGVVLFSALMLYQTQSIVAQCERLPQHMNYDPISASIGIYMSAVNLFVRILNILSNSKRKWDGIPEKLELEKVKAKKLFQIE